VSLLQPHPVGQSDAVLLARDRLVLLIDLSSISIQDFFCLLSSELGSCQDIGSARSPGDMFACASALVFVGGFLRLGRRCQRFRLRFPGTGASGRICARTRSSSATAVNHDQFPMKRQLD
jgi:hypothetical protein